MEDQIRVWCPGLPPQTLRLPKGCDCTIAQSIVHEAFPDSDPTRLMPVYPQLGTTLQCMLGRADHLGGFTVLFHALPGVEPEAIHVWQADGLCSRAPRALSSDALTFEGKTWQLHSHQGFHGMRLVARLTPLRNVDVVRILPTPCRNRRAPASIGKAVGETTPLQLPPVSQSGSRAPHVAELTAPAVAYTRSSHPANADDALTDSSAYVTAACAQCPDYGATAGRLPSVCTQAT